MGQTLTSTVNDSARCVWDCVASVSNFLPLTKPSDTDVHLQCTISSAPPGHVTWQREEALATITTLQMLDLPAGESEITESFVSLSQSEGNPIKVVIKRLQLQAMLAKVTIAAGWRRIPTDTLHTYTHTHTHTHTHARTRRNFYTPCRPTA